MESIYHRSSQWNQIDSVTKRKLNLTIDSDGEFYMNFDRDFLKVILSN